MNSIEICEACDIDMDRYTPVQAYWLAGMILHDGETAERIKQQIMNGNGDAYRGAIESMTPEMRRQIGERVVTAYRAGRQRHGR